MGKITKDYKLFMKSVIVACLAICITILGLGLQGIRPTRVFGQPMPFNGQNYLISTAGLHNATLAQQLLDIAQNVNRTDVGGTHYVATATDIRTHLGTALPTVQLFEIIDDTERLHVTSFTTQEWRLVNITFPNGGGSPIFTFLMAGSYRNSAFAEGQIEIC